MLTRSAILIALSVATFSAGQATPVPPQNARPAQGAIAGRVVDVATGAAVAGAAITIRVTALPGQPPIPPSQRPGLITDSDGRFVATGLAQGRVEVTASARGYIPQFYGALRPGGSAQPIDIAAGERVTNIVVPLSKEATISGRILDDAGEPVEGINVGILRKETIGGRARYTTAGAAMTDDRGIYRSSGLPPGRYVMAAAATPLQTTPRSFMDLVVDTRTASREDQATFQRTVNSSNLAMFSESGYRVGDLYLTGISGGPFLFSPPDANGNFIVVDSAFYPAARAPGDAEVLTVTAGENRSGIDVNLQMVPSSSISGVVTRSDGGPLAHLGVRLALESLGQMGTFNALETGATVTDLQGRFTMLGVPRGAYLIRARVIPIAAAPNVDPGPVLSAVVPVSVSDAPVRGVTVALTEAPRVAGRVEFEGAAPTAAEIAKLSIDIQTVDTRYPYDPSVPRGPVGANLEFVTIGITPGSYVIRASGLPGWTVKSAMAATKDISDEPFSPSTDIRGIVVTLTKQAVTVSGVVTRTDGVIDPEASVLAFPADLTRLGVRRRQSARVDKKGSYSMAGLPAGEYVLIAINDRFAADWEDAAFLNAAKGLGTRVTVPSVGAIAIDLRTSSIRRDQP